MKIVVIDGTGLIDSKTVAILRQGSHDVVAASANAGLNCQAFAFLLQPIAADDVAAVVTEAALANPRNGIIEMAGPERAPFNEGVARQLKAVGDPREVVKDTEARYSCGRLEEKSLVPLGEAPLGRLNLEEWLRHSRKGA